MTPSAHDAPILLTGATGFLGRHVLQAIEAAWPGRAVYVLVRSRSAWESLDYAKASAAIPLEGELTGGDAWLADPRLNHLGGIIHLAAVVHHNRRNPGPLLKANVEGTLRMVRLAARQATPMVFVSTSGTVACHPSPRGLVDETGGYIDKQVASWPYYASKIEAERRARAIAGAAGVPLTIMRPPVLLGPGDHRFRSSSNVLRYLRGSLPFLIDGGISFCDVRDAAAAVVAALGHPARRPVYHLPGHDMTVPEFFQLLESIDGRPAPRRILPYGLAHRLAGLAEAAAHRLGKHSPLPDPVVVEMARCHWGIASRYVEPELGYRTRDARSTLLDTITWLKANHPALATPRA